MTAYLLGILTRIHPILGNLSGIPLLVFVVVTVLTAIFLLGYATQGVRVGIQLWLAVRGITALRRDNKTVKPADVANVLRHRPYNILGRIQRYPPRAPQSIQRFSHSDRSPRDGAGGNVLHS